MELTTLLSFCAAWAALVVLPGPDTALVAGLGITRGRRAAAGAAVGSCSALAVHVTAVGVGLSALLASSATLFTALKLVGAAYLVAMGLRLILARGAEAAAAADAPAAADAARAELPLTTAYRRGLLCGVTNPKSAVFFLTFLPQFLDADRPALPQLALLGLATVAIAVLWHLTIIVAVGRLRSLAARPRVQEVVERLTGTAFVVIGSRLATAAR